MGRRWYPELIPDIEILDSDGRCFVAVSFYSEGRWTIGEFEYPDDEPAH